MSAAASRTPGLAPRHWLLATLLGVLGLAFGLSPHTHSAQRAVPVIQNFDASRYAGPWYVLARIDHPAEQGLIQTGVYYRRNDDGTLSMVQRGLDPTSRQWSKRENRAAFTGAPHQGALKLSPQGAFQGDYNVVALDPNYRWSLVLGASAKRAWVLSRTPSLPGQAQTQVLQQARAAGVNLEQLRWIPQERASAPQL